MSILVSKPNSLQEQQEWLRAKEVIKIFPCAESTLFYWRDKGILKNWKKVSPRITVYSRKELEELFNPTPEIPKKKRKKKKSSTNSKPIIRRQKSCHTDKAIAIPIIKQSKEADDKMIATYVSKNKKLNDERTRSKPIRKKHKKPLTAKEGIIGIHKKAHKGRVS